MKATHWMMYTLLGITLLLTACVDDDKDLSQPKEPEKTTDLNPEIIKLQKEEWL